MATSFLSTSLLLLAIILSMCIPLDSTSVSPLSSAAATINYWNRKIPNNAPHPDFLLSLLSPLPASLASSLPSPLSISSSFCQSANILGPNSTYQPTVYHTTGCEISFGYTYGCNGKSFPAASLKPSVYFRESELKQENLMTIPKFGNTKPNRSFLPRSIADKIPFKADAIKSLFRLKPNTTLAKSVEETVGECEHPPSKGETKRCATSVEDIIDFAVQMLGDNIVPRTTQSSDGSGGLIMIGKLKNINSGRSVSCHQDLFPYMVYTCHSVPKTRVYEVEMLSVETKETINTGVALCHLDTSAWNPRHTAFVVLDGKPGKIEVCHWILNGDMTWVIADNGY